MESTANENDLIKQAFSLQEKLFISASMDSIVKEYEMAMKANSQDKEVQKHFNSLLADSIQKRNSIYNKLKNKIG